MKPWLDRLFLRFFAIQLSRSATRTVSDAGLSALTMMFLLVICVPAGLLLGMLPQVIPGMPVRGGGTTTLVVAICIAPAWIALSRRFAPFRSTPESASAYQRRGAVSSDSSGRAGAVRLRPGLACATGDKESHAVFRSCLIAALCLRAALSPADVIATPRLPSASDVAARYLPNDAARVVHVASAHAWGMATPLVIAFYEYPVALADPRRNYGDAPGETEVLGIVFEPAGDATFRRWEIAGFGPEGANADIAAVFFARTDASPVEKLFVMVQWHTNAGVLYGTFVYDRPDPTSSATRLVHLAALSERFGLECDRCDGAPSKAARFKTAADVKAELARWHR